MRPRSIVPENGGCSQSVSSSTGTTSVCDRHSKRLPPGRTDARDQVATPWRRLVDFVSNAKRLELCAQQITRKRLVARVGTRAGD